MNCCSIRRRLPDIRNDSHGIIPYKLSLNNYACCVLKTCTAIEDNADPLFSALVACRQTLPRYSQGTFFPFSHFEIARGGCIYGQRCEVQFNTFLTSSVNTGIHEELWLQHRKLERHDHTKLFPGHVAQCKKQGDFRVPWYSRVTVNLLHTVSRELKQSTSLKNVGIKLTVFGGEMIVAD